MDNVLLNKTISQAGKWLVGLILLFLATAAISAEKSLWQLVCHDKSRGAACSLQYALHKSDSVISKILIYKLENKLILEYTVPLGINVQKGVELMVDHKYKFETTLLTCSPEGCTGMIWLDSMLRWKLKQGQHLGLKILNYKTNQAYTLNYNLQGFTEAYDALIEGQR